MRSRAYQTALLTIGLLFFSGLSFGQTGAIAGKVMGEDGEPVQGALVKIERQDVRGNYKVKTKKKGEYFHAGLPLGQYRVIVNVDGKDVDQMNGVRVGIGDPTEINFDLKRVAAQREQAASGQVTEEQLRQMSPEDRKKYEESLKKRREQLSKNKELNETFNTGMEAMQTQNYMVAVEALTKASELDPEQTVVWANLGEAQSKLALSKTGDERNQLMEQGIASYRKAIELQPENASFHNNLGLILVRAGKLEEGKAELTQAAQLDPANGGKYYFNLGAIMVNTGNNEGAIEAFRKATELDPNYAPAYYQLGTALVGSAQVGEDGSVKPVPGTVEAFEKYLELEPNGPMAQGAQGMLQSLKGTVETTYQDPDRRKRKR